MNAATQTGPLAAAGFELDEATARLLDLEQQLGLFDVELEGCRIWEHLRAAVHERIQTSIGRLGPRQEPRPGAGETWRRAGAIARSVLLRNPYRSGPVDLLFLGHPRRRLEPDGTWWDPYCDPVIEALEDRYRILLVERPHAGRHFEPARTGARARHLEALTLRSCLRRVPAPRPRFAPPPALVEMQRRLRAEFDPGLEVLAAARARLALRRGQLPAWLSLLRRLRPRALVLVVSYGNEIPIEACRMLGVPTVELQHGLISPINLGYHFPVAGCTKRAFPDWLLTFGDHWRRAASFPIPPERVLPVGYPYLESRRVLAAPVARRRQVVFVSQRSVGERLSTLAVEVARRAQDWQVVYKLHPGERRTWRSEYPWLAEAGIPVVEDGGEHLYRLLAASRVQVGVYSTALLEGLALGCRTIVLQAPGAEAMAGVVRAVRGLRPAGGAEDVLAALAEEDGEAPGGVVRLFRPGAVQNVRAAFETILEAS